MKKSLFLLMVALPVAGFAQNSKWSVGLNYSHGVSTVTNQPQAKMNKPSMAIGGQFFYHINQHLELSTGLQYSVEGFRTVYDSRQTADPLYFITTERARFIRVPLQARYTFMPEQKIVRPYIVAGVSAGFRIYSTHDKIYTTNDDHSREFVSRIDAINTISRQVDLGLYGAGGVKIRLTNRLSLTAEAGFYRGLLDVTQYDQEYQNQQNAYHQNLRGQVALQFGL